MELQRQRRTTAAHSAAARDDPRSDLGRERPPSKTAIVAPGPSRGGAHALFVSVDVGPGGGLLSTVRTGIAGRLPVRICREPAFRKIGNDLLPQGH